MTFALRQTNIFACFKNLRQKACFEFTSNIWFYIAFFINFAVVFFEFPTLSYHSELWAEQGTNYLYNARYLSFFRNLLTVDAGYLVLFPRLIAFFVYEIFPVRLFPLITNLFAGIFVSFSVSFFSRKGFCHIIKSNFLRFIICLLLGFGMSNDYGNHTFVNFVYHGMYFSFFIMFYDKKKTTRFSFMALTMLNALVCCSKFHFVLFFLPYSIMLFISKKRHLHRDFVFYLFSLLFISIQLLHLLLTYKTTNSFAGWASVSSMEGLIGIFPKLVLKAFWFHVQAYSDKTAIIYCVFIASFVVFTAVRLFSEKKLSIEQFSFFLIANYISFAYLGISTITHLQKLPLGSELGLWRAAFISVEIVFISILFVMYHAYLASKNNLLPLFCFALYVHNFADFKNHPVLKRDFYDNSEHSYSNWAVYEKLFHNDDYYIPINPDGWHISKNCERIMTVKVSDKVKIPTLNYSIRAVFLNHAGSYFTTICAYSATGELLGIGNMLSSSHGKKYVLFEDKVSPAYIEFIDADNNPVLLPLGTEIELYGTAPKANIQPSPEMDCINCTFEGYENFEEIQVAVWSEEGGQDDLQWFHVPEYGKKSIVYSIPLRTFRTNGKYFIHVYGLKDNAMIFVSERKLNIYPYKK